MRVVAAVVALLLSSCAPEPGSPEGAPIDERVVQVAQKAGLLRCPEGDGRGEIGDLELTCLTSGTDAALNPREIPLVINLWASWCQPCRDELPLLARASKEYGTVQFAGVLFADAAPVEALELAQASGVTYPQYADVASVTKAPLRLRGLPQTVFVDKTGQIVGVQYTPYKDYATLVADVERFLGVAL